MDDIIILIKIFHELTNKCTTPIQYKWYVQSQWYIYVGFKIYTYL